jgi:hypothetical protein
MRMLEMKGKIDNDRNMDDLLNSPGSLMDNLKNNFSTPACSIA